MPIILLRIGEQCWWFVRMERCVRDTVEGDDPKMSGNKIVIVTQTLHIKQERWQEAYV